MRSLIRKPGKTSLCYRFRSLLVCGVGEPEKILNVSQRIRLRFFQNLRLAAKQISEPSRRDRFCRASLTGLLLYASVCTSGCYRVRLEAPVSGGRVIRERQHFFAFGLIGDNEINLKDMCASGVTSFGDEVRPLDLLFTVATLGLYAPKTVVVRCAA